MESVLRTKEAGRSADSATPEAGVRPDPTGSQGPGTSAKVTPAIYLRVSTNSQECASQWHDIQKWLQDKNITDFEVYEDTASGTVDTRPQFLAMCAAIQTGRHDTVIVWRLDRLSRKSTTALQLLLDWIKGGVAFISVSQPILHLGHENPFRLTFASLMAEIGALEREAIVTRVKAGLRAAKARGVKLGADAKLTPEQLRIARDMRRQGHSCRQVARQLGVSASTISRRT